MVMIIDRTKWTGNKVQYCTCCGRELKGRVRYLELDQRDYSYHDRGDVPEDRSQGWFPFGLTCAKNVTKPRFTGM